MISVMIDTWLDFMRLDIKMLMDCDAVAMLDGWQDSRVAVIECRLAESLGFRVKPLADFLN